jgi:3-dehydroquinate dehydratase-2
MLSEEATKLGCKIEFFQNNIEGEIINKINNLDESYDGIIINPGGLTHTSVTLRDAVVTSGLKTVEVHISNIYAREDFRHKSLISGIATAVVAGMGYHGYLSALKYLYEEE